MLRDNTSIAFVVDRRLRVLLWSNGLMEATNLTQDTVEGRDVSSLPFLSEDNRDNTTAAIRQLFLTGPSGTSNEEGGSKRSLVVALVPGARTAAGAKREVLLQFTATFFEDHQHVVCIGRELEGALSSLLQGGHQALSEMSSLTSETASGKVTEMSMVESSLKSVASPVGVHTYKHPHTRTHPHVHKHTQFVQPETNPEADWRDLVALSTPANDTSGSSSSSSSSYIIISAEVDEMHRMPAAGLPQGLPQVLPTRCHVARAGHKADTGSGPPDGSA